jgi:arsenite methyltransferase
MKKQHRKRTQEELRRRYAAMAHQVTSGNKASCTAVTANLYRDDELVNMPEAAVHASLGAGNPSARAGLRPGQTVLDLGSGGGLDVLLCARRVGASGKAYGLDTTDAMIALAQENQRKAGVTNAEFLKGDIERIPLPDGSIDVVVSNCVINLSVNKRQAVREAFRVLKPGGEFAVADIVQQRSIARNTREQVERRLGCVAGTLTVAAYRTLLADAGFVSIEIEPTREHEAGFVSAFIRAIKPHAK